MPRLHCDIPLALDEVITRAHIFYNGKSRALNKLIDLALADTGEYTSVWPYGQDKKNTATISNYPEAKYDATYPYRDKHNITNQAHFFRFALQHGASIWEKLTPEQKDRTKKPKV